MTPNQERVLHGLNSCGFYDGIPNICEVTECPYRDDKCGCVHELAHDAGLLISELLKAQEPVEYVVHCKNADLSNGTEFACGECGGSLLHKKVNYCPWCGRAVRWE